MLKEFLIFYIIIFMLWSGLCSLISIIIQKDKLQFLKEIYIYTSVFIGISFILVNLGYSFYGITDSLFNIFVGCLGAFLFLFGIIYAIYLPVEKFVDKKYEKIFESIFLFLILSVLFGIPSFFIGYCFKYFPMR